MFFINIKHKENRLTKLPPGMYTNCRFINIGRLGEVSGAANARYEFNNCYFEWSSHPLFYMGPAAKVEFFLVRDSYFFNPANSDYAFFLNGKWGNFNLSDNTFYYPNGSNYSMIELLNTTTADSVVFTDNTFISKNNMKAVKADNSPNIPLVFKDNNLRKVKIQLNDNHYVFDNIMDNILNRN